MAGGFGVGASIAPWLAVRNGAMALAHYQEALGAEEVYRLDEGEGRVVVAQLRVGDGTLWLQEDPANSAERGGPRAARLIVTVDDPDAWFARAIAAGATQVAAVHEAHGWRTGRVTDPFGHDWEFSKQLVQ